MKKESVWEIDTQRERERERVTERESDKGEREIVTERETERKRDWPITNYKKIAFTNIVNSQGFSFFIFVIVSTN